MALENWKLDTNNERQKVWVNKNDKLNWISVSNRFSTNSKQWLFKVFEKDRCIFESNGSKTAVLQIAKGYMRKNG